MSGRHAAPRPRRARPSIPVVLAFLGAFGLVGGWGTLAYWNDSAAVSGTTVASGSLDLRVGGQDSYTWSTLSISSMAPGESTAESLTISNAGTTPFTVTITSTVAALDVIRTAVLATVRTGSTASTTSASYPRTESCSGTGNITYGPAVLPTGSTTVLGPSATIPAGGTLTFCVLLAFDSTAGNTTMSQTYAPSFTITATQA
jgi:predicted ribosomally synthesized peptide with SipW-like signal peptide